MPNVNSISLTAPTDYGVELQSADRRRRLAELLQQQGLQPTEQQTAGGYVIPTAPTQHLAKLAQVLAGTLGQNRADEKEKEIAQRYQTDRTRDVDEALALGRGTPAQQPAYPNDDEGNPLPGVDAVPGSQQAMYARLLRSMDPGLQQMGIKGSMDEMQERRMMEAYGLNQPNAATGSPQAAPGAVGGPTAAGSPPGLLIPRNIALQLMLADPSGKLLAEANAKAYAEHIKPIVGREGGQVLERNPDGSLKVSFSSPKSEPGVNLQFGPQGVTGAQGIPGYNDARAATLTAEERAKANFRTMDVPTPGFPGSTMPTTVGRFVDNPSPVASPVAAPTPSGATRAPTVTPDMINRITDPAKRAEVMAAPVTPSAPIPTSAVIPRTQTPGERQAQVTKAEADAKRVQLLEEKIPSLNSTYRRLDRLEQLTQNGETYASAGAEIKTLLGSVAQGLGLKVNTDKTANTEEYIAHIAELLKERLSSKDYGSGTGISNLDLAAAGRPLPQVMSTPQGRMQIISAIKADTERALKDATAARDYFEKNTSLREFRFPSEDPAGNQTFQPTGQNRRATDNKPLSPQEKQELQELRQRLKGRP